MHGHWGCTQKPGLCAGHAQASRLTRIKWGCTVLGGIGSRGSPRPFSAHAELLSTQPLRLHQHHGGRGRGADLGCEMSGSDSKMQSRLTPVAGYMPSVSSLPLSHCWALRVLGEHAKQVATQRAEPLRCPLYSLSSHSPLLWRLILAL